MEEALVALRYTINFEVQNILSWHRHITPMGSRGLATQQLVGSKNGALKQSRRVFVGAQKVPSSLNTSCKPSWSRGYRTRELRISASSAEADAESLAQQAARSVPHIESDDRYVSASRLCTLSWYLIRVNFQLVFHMFLDYACWVYLTRLFLISGFWTSITLRVLVEHVCWLGLFSARV